MANNNQNQSSNNNGRGYEFACINILKSEIEKKRPCKIEENSSYFANKRAWETLNTQTQNEFKKGAMAMVNTLFDMEPLILENDNDELTLSFQKDSEGQNGDVRDIIIKRKNLEWEIGLSLKHNNFAVKHPRLSNNIDFGEKWYGHKCSDEYWDSIKEIFEYLNKLQKEGKEWNEVLDKQDGIYVPLLEAFKCEIMRCYKNDNKLPAKIVEYLLGKYDFYKVISIDAEELTEIQAYNLHSKLNQKGKNDKPIIVVPKTALPKKIYKFDFKEDSKTTLILAMDNGWQLTFRIHNAKTRVEPSLKFDVRIVGVPITILTINCKWSN